MSINNLLHLSTWQWISIPSIWFGNCFLLSTCRVVYQADVDKKYNDVKVRWGNLRNDLFRTIDHLLILRVTHITYDHSEIALSFSVIIKLLCKPNTKRDNICLTLAAQEQKHAEIFIFLNSNYTIVPWWILRRKVRFQRSGIRRSG